MWRSVALLLGTCVFSMSVHAESAADGVWNFSMSSPMGSVMAVVTLKTDGEKLTGNFDLGNGRTWTVDDGVVAGDEVTFSITRDGASFTYQMKAKVNGDSAAGMAMAMGTEVPWSMTRQ